MLYVSCRHLTCPKRCLAQAPLGGGAAESERKRARREARVRERDEGAGGGRELGEQDAAAAAGGSGRVRELMRRAGRVGPREGTSVGFPCVCV